MMIHFVWWRRGHFPPQNEGPLDGGTTNTHDSEQRKRVTQTGENWPDITATSVGALRSQFVIGVIQLNLNELNGGQVMVELDPLEEVKVVTRFP
jgi:hypothetical protein